jgi:hypothetical protein
MIGRTVTLEKTFAEILRTGFEFPSASHGVQVVGG